jgi:outer membrane protein
MLFEFQYMDAKNPFKKNASLIFLILLMISFDAHSEVLNLARALELARDNNPQYLGARAGIAAARARHRQALAQALPQLSASATRNWSHRNYETLAPLFPTPPEITNYNADNDQVTLTQPLYRRAQLAALAQTRAEVRQNEYELLATEQEMLLKLVETWLDLIVARDSVAFTSAQANTTRRQLEQFEKASQIQLAAGPDLEDARAKFAQADADHAAAEVDLQEKLSQLEELIGPIDSLPALTLAADASAPTPPDIAKIEDLLLAAEEGNPAVLAAEEALVAANKEVSKQRAGYEPTVDIVGNYGRNKQEAGNFPGQSGYDIRQRSIGLQVNVPLYTSGLQQAKVSEAVALRAKATHDLESAIRTARTNARLAWFRFRANQVRVSATRQMVRSSQVALRAKESGAANGLNYDVDVLRAKQDYLQAQRDLHKAQAEMMLDSLRLRAALGALEDEDIVSLDDRMHVRSVAEESP